MICKYWRSFISGTLYCVVGVAFAVDLFLLFLLLLLSLVLLLFLWWRW
jgi:hypothetical protein